MLEESNYSFALFLGEVVAAAKYTASLFYRSVPINGYDICCLQVRFFGACHQVQVFYRKHVAEMNYMSLQIARERMKRQRAQ